jgi:hypothetical protein
MGAREPEAAAVAAILPELAPVDNAKPGKEGSSGAAISGKISGSVPVFKAAQQVQAAAPCPRKIAAAICVLVLGRSGWLLSCMCCSEGLGAWPQGLAVSVLHQNHQPAEHVQR